MGWEVALGTGEEVGQVDGGVFGGVLIEGDDKLYGA